MFAFVLYVALFHIIALSGIRQQIATSGCFIAYLLLSKDKYIWASLIIILSGFFHISSLVFGALVGLYIMNVKWKWNLEKFFHACAILLIPVMLSSLIQFVSFIASFLENEYYQGYAEDGIAGGAMTYVVLMESLSVICFLFINKDILKSQPHVKIMYQVLPLATILVPLVTMNGAMIRLGQYFTIFMLMLFPYAIEGFFTRYYKWVYSASIFILLVLSLNNEYYYAIFP